MFAQNLQSTIRSKKFRQDRTMKISLFLVSDQVTALATSCTLILTVAGNISPGSECRRRERIETFIVRATNMIELCKHV